MFMQAGNAVVAKDDAGAIRPTLTSGGAESVLNFYTEFANPVKPTYSWNRAQPDSRSAFLSARAAVYFGFGSELPELRKGNPNLNFDAAFFPRPRSSSLSITYGKLTGIAVIRGSRNPSKAFEAALTLSGNAGATAWSKASGLPPARRDLLAAKRGDAFGSILYDSAIRARAFLDPNPPASAVVFQTMIEAVTSGKTYSSEALSRANSELGGLIR